MGWGVGGGGVAWVSNLISPKVKRTFNFLSFRSVHDLFCNYVLKARFPFDG